eukprot:6359576-Prymnesium_polylepis.1
MLGPFRALGSPPSPLQPKLGVEEAFESTSRQQPPYRASRGRDGAAAGAARPDHCPVVDPSTLGGYVTGVGVLTRVVSGVRPVV